LEDQPVGEYAINVELRQDTGKGVARKLRAAGRIPGVCYRHGADPVAVSLDPKLLKDTLRKTPAGMNTLFDLKVEGGGDFDGRQVLVKEIQIDPVSRVYLHADLYAVNLTEMIHVSVPIHIVGSAAGVALGGVLDHALRVVEVQCLPNAIPEEFGVDVTALEVGQSLHVRDLTVPEGVEVLGDQSLSIVSVVAPTTTAADAEAEATEGAEAADDAGDAAASADGGAKDKGDS
jgi:large subunit ribosomal protein L25